MARVKTQSKWENPKRFRQATQAYVALRQKITGEGILARSYGYYTFLIAAIFACYLYSGYQIFVTPLSISLVFWCLLFGFFMVQIGGLMHDAGHRAIAQSSRVNDIWGYIFGGTVAVGYGAWNQSHNKHHSHTNQEEEDPDLDLPLHGFTQRQFAKQKGLWRLLRRYQAYIYYPLRSLTTFTRRMEPLPYFRERKTLRYAPEAAVWIAGLFVYFVLPFIIFDIAKAATVFLVVHFFSGFYMSNIFAPNHKGMPQLPKDAKISFLEHQIMTSRNVYGNPLTDFVFLGLNYQIEHHLFPNCPRNKIQRISPYVQEVCRDMNLEYTQVGILESNRIILAELAAVARA